MLNKKIEALVNALPVALRDGGLYPESYDIDGPTTETVVMVAGQRKIQFCSGNYLGLGTHPLVVGATISALNKYGMTSSGSRLICGTQEPHLELEQLIAEFQGDEASIVYFLVTVASAGSISGILNPHISKWLAHLGLRHVRGERQIFLDALSHPSLVEACISAVGKDNIRTYHHNDMDDLEAKLQKSVAGIKVIATDGLFSTDGDLAKLPDLSVLAERYEAMLVVDDAHATGVFGENGRGTWEHFGVGDKVDLKIGSLAKSFSGGLGAFVTGDKSLTDYLRTTGGHFMFGGAIPPAIAAGISASIQVSISESWRRRVLLENATYFRDQLHSKGFDTLGSESQIVPVLIGDDADAIGVSMSLYEQGFLAPAFRYPAVPQRKARLRVTLMATHTIEQIDGLIRAIERATRS